jgi:hypothetical protein
MTLDFSVFPVGPFSSQTSITMGSSMEAEDISKFLSDRNAADITLDVLNSSYPHDPAACLAFMTPTAFAFFLPVWMRISLNDYERADVIPETVIGYLLALAEGKNPERLSAIRSSYSREQLSLVAKFLQEMSSRYWQHYPTDLAKKALSLYWGDLGD